MIVSVFTPIYNRASLLNNLYESLLNQTQSNFEWIIVDDGSTDNVEFIVDELKKENKIRISYFSQKNSGKHIAINKGVELANGELFMIVDSDDYLLPNAIEFINEHYDKIKDNDYIAGLSGRRGYSEFEPIGSENFNSAVVLSYLDFRLVKQVVGDMAEVIKTNVLRNYPFPNTSEKFCPEALVWNRISLTYKMYWLPNVIYIGEYLKGGLSDKIVQIRRNSPINSTTYYSELEKMPIPFIQKIKANINYWRFARFLKGNFMQKFKKVSILLSLIGLPLSLIFVIIDMK